jgi:hypothetical protein
MMHKRRSSTIPYGYKLNADKSLEPVEKEIKALEDAKEGVKAGAFSLRGAVEILEHQTGRKLSAMGLKKIIDKDTDRPSPSNPNGLLSKTNA